jgi:hypothetical protein
MSQLEEIRGILGTFGQTWIRKVEKSPRPRQVGNTPLLQRGERWNSVLGGSRRINSGTGNTCVL